MGHEAGDGGRKRSRGLLCVATEHIIYHQDDGDPLKGFNRGGYDPTGILDASLA